MITKRKITNIVSISLAIILVLLASTITLITIFFPGPGEGGGDSSALGGYDSRYDTPNLNELPSDLNNLFGDLNEGSGGGGGGHRS